MLSDHTGFDWYSLVMVGIDRHLNVRITSYNVCYTKLLRMSDYVPAESIPEGVDGGEGMDGGDMGDGGFEDGGGRRNHRRVFSCDVAS